MLAQIQNFHLKTLKIKQISFSIVERQFKVTPLPRPITDYEILIMLPAPNTYYYFNDI